MKLVLDGPLPTLRQIQDEIKREIAEFGFLGDADTPVELDKRPQSHIVHAINHLHIDGKCVKSRYGFCTDLTSDA